ncbi:MAG TPA: hypothetical protein VK699_05460 [Terriglobales bacterium]|jgi:hypothetical protein|nr:hypothetical protein [Terriglobales bacterium]
MKTFLAILLMSICVVAAQKDVQWKTGKLLSIGKQHWTSYEGSTTTGRVDDNGNINASNNVEARGHNTFRAQVDDGEYTYFAERTLNWRFQHEPILTENDDVKFRIEGKDDFILQDDRGKEFKMKLIKKRKDDSPNSSPPPR